MRIKNNAGIIIESESNENLKWFLKKKKSQKKNFCNVSQEFWFQLFSDDGLI